MEPRRRGTAHIPHREYGLKGGVHGGSKDNSLKQRFSVAERVKHSEQLLCVLAAALLRAVPRIPRLAISARTLVVPDVREGVFDCIEPGLRQLLETRQDVAGPLLRRAPS